jgi:hypothetical protein
LQQCHEPLEMMADRTDMASNMANTLDIALSDHANVKP